MSVFEFSKYFVISKQTELLIDNNKRTETLRINVDITMHALPCSILNIDISDFTGAHTSNVKGKLKKVSLDKNGKIVKENFKTIEKDQGHNSGKLNFDEIVRSFDNKEGCQLTGSFEVMRLPGNFHVSSHSFAQVLHYLEQINKKVDFNLTHTINHISFEDEADSEMIKKKFNQGILTPMDGLLVEQDRQKTTLLNYYIQIIPTEYQDLEGEKYSAFQFTYTQKNVPSGRMIPTIFFRYDISPMLVKFTLFNPGHFNGIINICAIFGGMYTIAGILNTLILGMCRKRNVASI